MDQERIQAALDSVDVSDLIDNRFEITEFEKVTDVPLWLAHITYAEGDTKIASAVHIWVSDVHGMPQCTVKRIVRERVADANSDLALELASSKLRVAA